MLSSRLAVSIRQRTWRISSYTRFAISLGAIASECIPHGLSTSAAGNVSQTEKKSEKASMVRFVGGSAILYDPRKIQEGRSGEDALFLNRWAAGVADGVGGWAEMGIDAGIYARQLCEAAAWRSCAPAQKPVECPSQDATSEPTVDSSSQRLGDLTVARLQSLPAPDAPFDGLSLAQEAFHLAKSLGSSTLCIATAKVGGVDVYNIGDSGARLLRVGVDPATSKKAAYSAWGVAAASEEQTHYFNCPFYLSCPDPTGDLPPGATEGSIYDTPSMGITTNMRVRPGDVLVLATDGVFDNLFDKDVLDLARGLDARSISALAYHELQRLANVNAKIDDGAALSEAARAAGHANNELEGAVKTTCQSFAAALAVRSYARGAREAGESPFYKSAAKHGYLFQGGKLDDSTCVVLAILPDVTARFLTNKLA